MTIDELHDYCRYLLDKNHVHGVPDKWSEGYEFALSLVMFKCHEVTDEDRKAVADWREKHWKDRNEQGNPIVECTHCGETVGTYYVTCPYCGYRLAVHSLPPREKCTD